MKEYESCVEKGIWDDEFINKKEAYIKLREISHQYGSHCAVDKQSAVHRCMDAITEINPIEVAPVIHAKWVQCDWLEPCVHGFGTIRYANKGLKCTNCVHVFKNDILWRDNYCPNCGAKMDLSGD